MQPTQTYQERSREYLAKAFQELEAGDLTQAADEGVLDWHDVCELHQILAGHVPGRTSEDQITLFESQGLAVEDVAMADYLYRKYR